MALDPFGPATRMTELLRSGAISSRELVELHLERIGRLDERVNAVLTVDADGARRRAGELDERLVREGPAGPLHGLPMTLKDCWATAGLRTTAGMEARADAIPDADAEVVRRLRAAGAVVLGKTNLPEEVTGQETANSMFGRSCNPWDPDRTTGGSSGGAAAAVATGLTPLEVGSDSGGSIRQPAHCCGVYGHFPTSGLVPLAGHLPSVAVDHLDVDVDLMAAGPLARDAEDLALAMQVLAGLEPLRAAPGRLRVALWLGDGETAPCRDVRAQIRAAAAALESAGAVVQEAAPPFDEQEARETAFQLWVAASASSVDDEHHARIAERAARRPPSDRSLPALRDRAQTMSHREWLRLDRRRRSLAQAWRQLFETADVVLCPVSPVPAVIHDPDPGSVDSVDRRLERTIDVDGRTRPYLDQIMWNIVVGVAGLPATAVPLRRTSDGLPVGAQVVGRRHNDALTISVAGMLGRLAGGYAVPPGFA